MKNLKMIIGEISILFISIIAIFLQYGCGNCLHDKVDKEPPNITIISPTDRSAYGSGTIYIEGTSKDNVDVKRVEISLNKGNYISTTGKYNWSYKLDTSQLSDGDYRIQARSTDFAGNNTVTEIKIEISKTLPLARLSQLPRKISGLTSINLIVKGDDVVSYKYKLDDNDWSDETNTSTPIIAKNLNAGKHFLFVKGKNKASIWQEDSGMTYYQWSINTKYNFTATGNTENTYFGCDISISSDGCSVISGAKGDINDEGIKTGSAYIYKWNENTWIEKKIIPSNGIDGYLFGASVSISSDGNTAIVGAPYAQNESMVSSGAVYIYRWDGNNWNETKLISSNGADRDDFGISVSISADGSVAIVGAKNAKNKSMVDSGVAYIYRWDGSHWNEVILSAEVGKSHDQFGRDVSISADGNTTIIGAHLGRENGNTLGFAYIFHWDGNSWNETKLRSPSGKYREYFGRSVSISADGKTAIVGADNATNEAELNSGAAYIYKWNGSRWNETKLAASNGTSDDKFGITVFLSPDGDSAIVGASQDNENGINSGAAYIYCWDGSRWNETKLLAQDGSEGDYFGNSAALSTGGHIAIVGAIGEQPRSSFGLLHLTE